MKASYFTLTDLGREIHGDAIGAVVYQASDYTQGPSWSFMLVL